MPVDPVDQLRANGVRDGATVRGVAGLPPANLHITADGVTDAVRAEIGSISRQAVYDPLGTLVDADSSAVFSPPAPRTIRKIASTTTTTT